jgi:hypothetical protein
MLSRTFLNFLKIVVDSEFAQRHILLTGDRSHLYSAADRSTG